jgi:large subunit ribosomal protein L21
MFAVIKTGGKQYKVSKGDLITIEKIKGDIEEGSKIIFDEVLLVDDGSKTEVGNPVLKSKKVEAVVEKIGRNKKIKVVKWKSKTNTPITTKQGHKQPHFKVRISSITT